MERLPFYRLWYVHLPLCFSYPTYPVYVHASVNVFTRSSFLSFPHLWSCQRTKLLRPVLHSPGLLQTPNLRSAYWIFRSKWGRIKLKYLLFERMRLKCVLFVLRMSFFHFWFLLKRLSESRAHLLCLHLCSSNFNFEFDYHPIKSRWIF